MARELNSDFKELVSVLSSARVRYLVVGGHAVIEHTEPRYTKDLDVWVEATRENATRLWRALVKYGAPLKGVKLEDFLNPAIVYQMGVEPVRVDILTALDGVDFERAWARRGKARWGRVTVNVLSVADLIANKKRVGRPQDLLDVERLSAAARSSRSRKTR